MVNDDKGIGEKAMRLDGFFTPKVMLQIGVCGALVVGTYLISHERPKDNARLLTGQEEGPFSLGTKSDRLTVFAKTSGEGSVLGQSQALDPNAKPTQLATAAPAASAPVDASAAPVPGAAPKPKRVTLTAPPAVGHDMALPPSEPVPVVARPGPPPGWSPEGYPPAPVAAAPAPKPPQEDGLFGLPPMPSPKQVFDDTVKGTNDAFGKMKQAVEDVFRTN